MAKTEKIVLTNHTDKPLLTILEPWGRDFTLVAGGKIEVITEDCDENFYYDICRENEYIVVWVEGGSGNDPRIFSSGKEVFCGYNRELSTVGLPKDDILEAWDLE